MSKMILGSSVRIFAYSDIEHFNLILQSNLNDKTNVESKFLVFDIGGVITKQKNIDVGYFEKKFKMRDGTLGEILKDCYREISLNKKTTEEKYYRHKYETTLSWEKYKQVLDAIYKSESINRELVNWINSRKKNYKIIGLTNNSQSLDELISKKYRINGLFDLVINSCEVGVAKPDPRIFQYLLYKIKATARECVFVDDEIKNISVAEDLGFKVVHYKDFRRFKSDISKILI